MHATAHLPHPPAAEFDLVSPRYFTVPLALWAAAMVAALLVAATPSADVPAATAPVTEPPVVLAP